MLFLLALVVIGALVAVALMAAASGDDRAGRSRPGLLVGMPVAVIVGLVVAVALVVVFGAGFLLRGVGGPGHGSTPTAVPAPTAEQPRPPAAAPGTRLAGPNAPDLPVIGLRAQDTRRFASGPVVERLEPDSVVRVRARGFEPFEKGVAEQCVTELGRQASCAAPFPVQFGEDGRADFQYLLRSSFAPGRCRWGQPTCTLRVSGRESGRRAVAQTVFVDQARPGRVTVDPSAGVRDGQVVRVELTGFPPGTSGTAVLCAPPGLYDPRRCGSPTASSSFRLGPDGSGGANLRVRAGPVGGGGASCGPRRPCGVSVLTEEGFVMAPVVPLRFAAAPGAAYEPRRLAAGLSMAVVLLVVAVVLVRRTDWRGPSEADTPGLDEADLQTESSLDDLFGTDEELEARDPVHL